MYKTQYKLISSIHKNEFQTLLNRAIEEGWRIEGEMKTVYRQSVNAIEFSILVRIAVDKKGNKV